MPINIQLITQRVLLLSPGVTPGWPAFAAWVAAQLPRRTIYTFHDKHFKVYHWQDELSGPPSSRDSSTKYEDAVLGSEVLALFAGPPLNLAVADAAELRDHLISLGFLAAAPFPDGKPPHSVIRFRL